METEHKKSETECLLDSIERIESYIKRIRQRGGQPLLTELDLLAIQEAARHIRLLCLPATNEGC